MLFRNRKTTYTMGIALSAARWRSNCCNCCNDSLPIIFVSFVPFAGYQGMCVGWVRQLSHLFGSLAVLHRFSPTRAALHQVCFVICSSLNARTLELDEWWMRAARDGLHNFARLLVEGPMVEKYFSFWTARGAPAACCFPLGCEYRPCELIKQDRIYFLNF